MKTVETHELRERLTEVGDKYVYHIMMDTKTGEDGNTTYKYAVIELVKAMGQEMADMKANKLQSELTNLAVQAMLDSKAREYRYDDMTSVRSYAGYENPFQTETQKMAIWAANCWVKAGEIEAEVLGGLRGIPTIEEVLAEMPEL